MRLAVLRAIGLAAAAAPMLSAAQTELSWRSIDWANPAFSFPYERGEIRNEAGPLFRIDETFERPVAPAGPVSPQAANFWRSCVISHFAAKRGFSAWALVEGLQTKHEPTATTMCFMLGNTAADLPEAFRSGFFATSGFERLCGQFLKPEYHWWK